MKRIQLFEFEDLAWFPNWLRMPMTRYIVVIHRLLGSKSDLATLLAKVLGNAPRKNIVDMCSGGGGPMPAVMEELHQQAAFKDLSLTMTDLYPNTKEAARINGRGDPQMEYLTTSVDATATESIPEGLRTMICSLHHMPPKTARRILQSARDARQPICIFEISDNSSPKWLWWTAIPVTFLSTFFLTPLVRPMTWQQLAFTYIIPLLPIFIAWDGAVSNARTYSAGDLEILMKDLQGPGYQWETGVLKGKAKKSYILGWPDAG
jgi:hypothetical protein